MKGGTERAMVEAVTVTADRLVAVLCDLPQGYLTVDSYKASLECDPWHLEMGVNDIDKDMKLHVALCGWLTCAEYAKWSAVADAHDDLWLVVVCLAHDRVLPLESGPPVVLLSVDSDGTLSFRLVRAI